MADITLETGRLVLRPAAASDLGWLLAEMNTPAVMRHLGGPRSEQAVAESLAADVAAFAAGQYQRFTIWLREGERRIGRTGLFHVRSAAAPVALRGQREIGWSLASAHEGHGYATEAARAVLAHHFADPAQGVIHAQASDRNLASTRLIARLGFTRAAQLDYDDPDYEPAENPTRVYRLARADWSTCT